MNDDDNKNDNNDGWVIESRSAFCCAAQKLVTCSLWTFSLKLDLSSKNSQRSNAFGFVEMRTHVIQRLRAVSNWSHNAVEAIWFVGAQTTQLIVYGSVLMANNSSRSIFLTEVKGNCLCTPWDVLLHNDTPCMVLPLYFEAFIHARGSLSKRFGFKGIGLIKQKLSCQKNSYSLCTWTSPL